MPDLSLVAGNGLTFPRSGLETSVLWTRGRGCRELAGLLGSTEAVRVATDVTETALERRAVMVVSRKLTQSDLLSVAVPIDFDPPGIAGVVAAVAGGPNSRTAAMVARRLGEALGVPAFMACAYRKDETTERALSVVESLYGVVPDLEYRLLGADSAGELLSQLPPGFLLVIGAPGGNWFQRALFGRGARLRHKAAGGVVVVRSAPPRLFQVMDSPRFVSPHHLAADALRLHSHEMLAVVENGVLVGLVRRSALDAVDGHSPVAASMLDPRSVIQTARVSEIAAHLDRFGDSPIPVVDSRGRLVGSVTGPGGDEKA